jgi:hypothetical protein
MKDDPAFWRDLKVQFESLQNPRDHRTIAFLRSMGWSPQQREPFYSRWRSLAQRGGTVLSGTSGADAVEHWKEMLRVRVPHSWRRQWLLQDRDIPLSAINVPADTETIGSALRMTVEPISDDRYIVLSGGHLCAEVKARGESTIRCMVRVESGLLENIREASIELCEQLESDAVEAVVRAETHRHEPIQSGCDETAAQRASRRRVLIDPLLQGKNMSAVDWARATADDGQRAIDYNTINDFLNGTTQTLRTNTRTRLAKALGCSLDEFPL